VPLLTDAKNDPFVKFHVKQGLVLFILGVLVSVVSRMFMLSSISLLLNVGVIALAVVGIMNAANGKEEKLPVIGQFADNFKF
jgi:uncharacterized membrane protein